VYQEDIPTMVGIFSL